MFKYINKGIINIKTSVILFNITKIPIKLIFNNSFKFNF